jgi:hypothetical protein
MAHILLSGTYKSNNFSRPFSFAHFAQLACKNGKKSVLSTEIQRRQKKKMSRRERDKKGGKKKKKKGKGMRLTEQRGAKTLVTGLLGFFSLDTLVDLFTMDRYFFRGVNANTYLVTLHP